MKKLQPALIPLDELPEDGRTYQYDRESGELGAGLNEIIGSNDYQIEFTLFPAGGVYQITGRYETKMDLDCVICATEVKQPINESFSEIIFVQKKETARKDKRKRVHSPAKDGPHCHEVMSSLFDVAKYFHELIAMCEPLRPTNAQSCPTDCKFYQSAIAKGWLKPDLQNDKKKNMHQPFEVLKRLKPTDSN